MDVIFPVIEQRVFKAGGAQMGAKFVENMDQIPQNLNDIFCIIKVDSKKETKDS